jgi:hypothetical protein
MVEPIIRLRVDAVAGATAGERAHRLKEAILLEAPSSRVTQERDDPESQDAGSILLVALSHVSVIGVIEGVRFIWDRFREPVIVLLPDGSQISVKGATQEFVDSLKKFVGKTDVPGAAE